MKREETTYEVRGGKCQLLGMRNEESGIKAEMWKIDLEE